MDYNAPCTSQQLKQSTVSHLTHMSHIGHQLLMSNIQKITLAFY